MNERFERLAENHREALMIHARRLTHDPERAEDLVQSALLRALMAFDRFDGENFRGWVLTIVTNLHFNECKRLQRTATCPIEADEEFRDGTSSPFHVVADRSLAPEIMEAFSEMPLAQARTLMLVELAGFSHAEVAVAEGIPVGTVQSRTYRARAFLRDRLADYAREEYGVE